MRRATKSGGPPAGKATTMRMTRDGKSCAWMSAAANANNAVNTAAKVVFNCSGKRISTSQNYDLNARLVLDVSLIAWRSALHQSDAPRWPHESLIGHSAPIHRAPPMISARADANPGHNGLGRTTSKEKSHEAQIGCRRASIAARHADIRGRILHRPRHRQQKVQHREQEADIGQSDAGRRRLQDQEGGANRAEGCRRLQGLSIGKDSGTFLRPKPDASGFGGEQLLTRRSVSSCARLLRPRGPALTMRQRPVDYAHRQQPKGGDPVSHCLSPRLPASVSWILASMGVAAI